MSSSAPATPEGAELLPLDLAEAGLYATEREGFEHGLVVLATGNPYWLVPAEAGQQDAAPTKVKANGDASSEPSARSAPLPVNREGLGWG